MEESVSDSTWKTALANKTPLPQHPYYWKSYKAFSNSSNAGGATVSDFDVAGIDYFANMIDTGNYFLGVGNDKVSVDSMVRLKERMDNELLAKVTDSPIDLGVAIGEYKETAKMFSGIVERGADMLEGVKKHSYYHAWLYVNDRYIAKAVLRKARAAAKAWLYFSYAIKPMISDLLGGAEALARANGTKDECEVKMVTAEISPHTVGGRCSYSSYYFNCWADVRGTVSGKANVKYYVDNPLWQAFVNAGLAGTNIPNIAWELIPFSFVIDWFIPVGAFLQTINAPEGISNVHGYGWVKGRGRSQRSTVLLDRAPAWNTCFRETSTIKKRWIYNSLPKATLIVPDISLSKTQVASAMSLYFAKAGDLRP